MEVLVEACAFQNETNGFLRTGEPESAAIVLQALHRADQNREPGAVDIGNLREIDDETLGLFVNQPAERSAGVGGDVKIDGSFGSEDIRQ